MSDQTISSNDAGLVLHKFVTERTPVRAWFVSADKSVRVKIDGFVSGFERTAGLHIVSELVQGDAPIPSFLIVSNFANARFEYQDDAQVPEGFELTNGLRLNLPNGDTMIIAERRSKK